MGVTIPTERKALSAPISIHAPLAGRDTTSVVPGTMSVIVFQSTRPSRGATPPSPEPCPLPMYFNPRAPHGARLCIHLGQLRLLLFQSTRPMRGATAQIVTFIYRSVFQSTRPSRGATSINSVIISSEIFQSTRPHGRDDPNRAQGSFRPNFNPRAPRGARHHQRCAGDDVRNRISIHAPLAGRDAAKSRAMPFADVFQSTRTSRGATGKPRRGGPWLGISIHALLTGRDNPRDSLGVRQGKFQSTHPCGARPAGQRVTRLAVCHFNPRAPHGARLVFSCFFFLLHNFNPRAPHGARL